VRYYAASLDFIKLLQGTVALNEASLRAFYAEHPENYDSICFSYATVDSSNYSSFVADRHSGMSTASLAHKYGGSSCTSPGHQGYEVVRSQTLSQPLDTFPALPYIPQGASQGYFIAATSRTSNSFDTVSGQVLADARAYNAALAARSEASIIAASKVTIDPAFARWIDSQAKTAVLSTPRAKLTPFAGVGLS